MTFFLVLVFCTKSPKNLGRKFLAGEQKNFPKCLSLNLLNHFLAAFQVDFKLHLFASVAVSRIPAQASSRRSEQRGGLDSKVSAHTTRMGTRMTRRTRRRRRSEQGGHTERGDWIPKCLLLPKHYYHCLLQTVFLFVFVFLQLIILAHLPNTFFVDRFHTINVFG